MVGDEELSPSKRKKPAAVSLAAAVLAALTIVASLTARPPQALAATPGPTRICPDPIREGESDRVGMRWPGTNLLGPVTFHTLTRGHTADQSDFTGAERRIVSNPGDSDTVWVPVVTTEDSRTEYDETFEVGIFSGGHFLSCVITIVDDDAPAVTGVDITSDPARGDIYRSGENIDVTLTFDMAVDADDDAAVTLRFGDGDHHSQREATYIEGSGTRFVVFRYQVQPSDRDTDGIAVVDASTDDDDDPIHDLNGTVNAQGMNIPIDPTHAGIETASDHKVDGRPYVKHVGIISTPPDGWEAYRADQTIEIALNFDIDVEVEGEVRLGLYVGLVRDNWAEAWREADYLRGSATDTLVFGYTVQPGDTDIRGIAIPYGTTAVLGNGTIKAEGTDVEYIQHFTATGHLPDHKIDTTAPTISGIYMTSRPADTEAYQVGETITVDVAFREPVTKTGDLQLELDIGGTIRRATLQPDANPNRRYNNDMVFEYRIQTGDTDPNGIEIDTNSLKLNGGTIHDRAGNAANLTHEPTAANPHHMVHTNPDH